MDSGDNSNNQLKAPNSGFGGFRSQTFPNLFQGFFGVKSTTTSTTDLTSVGFEDKPSAGKSLETIVSPSQDESWILSHFLQARREKEDDKNLQSNVTWSGLGKFDYLHLHDSSSASSSMTDVTRTEPVSVPRILVTDGESSGNELREKHEALAQPKVVVAKNYQRNILSSFLSHDLPHSEVRQNDRIDELEQSHHQVSTSVAQSTASGDVTGLGDGTDSSLFPGAMTSVDTIHESKQTLRDFLWSLNHEKINVSKKEMNLIASIDQ